MRLLSERDVITLSRPDLAIAAAEAAYKALSSGHAQIPLRTEILGAPSDGVILVMPGLVREQAFGLKVIATKPDETEATGMKVASFVLIFDPESFKPLALISSDFLTDYRTAAGIAAATKILAREDCRTLTVYGAGKLAFPSIALVSRVRAFERLIIVGRSPARVTALVERLRSAPQLGSLAIEVCADPGAAAEMADVIVAVTSSENPIFDGRRVRPGTHINIGGAFRPDTRELDDEVARRALFFLDSRDSCLKRAGDVVIPLAAGTIAGSAIRGEIGQVLTGEILGRRTPQEITVFKSLGNAVQDLVFGRHLLLEAEAKQVGVVFEPNSTVEESGQLRTS